jgi:glutamine amidotransferase-like uncharacterized protein
MRNMIRVSGPGWFAAAGVLAVIAGCSGNGGDSAGPAGGQGTAAGAGSMGQSAGGSGAAASQGGGAGVGAFGGAAAGMESVTPSGGMGVTGGAGAGAGSTSTGGQAGSVATNGGGAAGAAGAASVAGAAGADASGPKAVLLYHGAPICQTCDTQIGNIIAAPKTAALKALAPKVSYVNNWADVAAALAALPPAAIFVIGGTDDDLSPWMKGGSQEMTASSIAAVQAFVKNGGRYLGICGGADVAPATYGGTSTLNLAPVDSTNFAKDTGKERVESVVWNDGQTYGLYFQEGSYFTMHPTTEHFEIEGNYLPMTTPLAHGAGIAAIQYSYGKGKVYVTGVHTEATADYWDSSKDIPAGWVPHTELLEQIVVDLFSTRVLN